jgi:hypothetical protein
MGKFAQGQMALILLSKHLTIREQKENMGITIFMYS